MKRRTLLRAPMLAAASVLYGTYALPVQAASGWRLQTRPVHKDLGAPVGLGYDQAGQLYVANWSAGTVLRFSLRGERTVFASGINAPSGLAVGPTGDIFVASHRDGLVWRFTPAGERSIFISGFATPAGLGFDARGRLLVANSRTNQLIAATPGRLQVVAQGLQTPVGAVGLPDGRLMVSNLAGGISVVGADMTPRTVNTDLRSPGPGMVLASRDAVFVVDTGGSTVSRIDVDGRRSIVVDGVATPVGLAKAPDGSLMVGAWVEDAVFRIRKR